MLHRLVCGLVIFGVCCLNVVQPVRIGASGWSIRGGQILRPIDPNEPTYCNAMEVFDNGKKCSGTPVACSNTPRMSARYGAPGSEMINRIHVQNNLDYCGDINCMGNHFELTEKNPCTIAGTPDPVPAWPVVGFQQSSQ